MIKQSIIVLGMLSTKELAWKTLNDLKDYHIVLIEEYKNKAISSYFQQRYFVKDLSDSKQISNIINKIENIEIAAILTFTEHLVTVAEELGKKYRIVSTENSIFARDKSLMRKKLAKNGIIQPVSDYFENVDQLKTISSSNMVFPRIIKPVSYTASMGVKLIENLEEIENQITNNRLYNKGFLLEEYIEGTEYSCEGYVQNGDVEILSTTQKIVEIKTNYFIEKGHILPVTINLENYINWVDFVIKSLGINNCVFHLEFKINKIGELIPIEIGARPGGGFIPDMLLGQTGINLYKIAIEIALGKKVRVCSTTFLPHQKYRAIGFILNNSTNTIDIIDDLNNNQRLKNVCYKESIDRNKKLYTSNLDREYFIDFVSSSIQDSINVIKKL